jgi:hypothetical protein
MYKVSSDKRQESLHRGRPGDWINGQSEQLSGNDLFRQLQEETRILENRIKQSLDKSERRDLSLQRVAAQNKISEMRKLGYGKKRPHEISHIFMRLAFEMLPKIQYQIIRDAAQKELSEIETKETELSQPLGAGQG